MPDENNLREDPSEDSVEPPQSEVQPQTAPEGNPKPSEGDSNPTPGSDVANTPTPPATATTANSSSNANAPRRYQLSGGWLSFTFYMLAYPAGTAAYAFFDWVKTHNVEGSLWEAWKVGVLTVEENFPTPDTSLGTTAMNTCMSSIIYTPFLLMLYAYRVLYIDYQSDRQDDLTPPENGLVAEAIRHAGVGWISNLMKIFFGKPRRNNSAMFVLKEAFAVCFIAYLFPIIFLLLFVLINAVRTQVPQTSEIREIPIAQPFNYSITQSACHPYDFSGYTTDRRGLPDLDWLNRNKPCGISSFSPDFLPLDPAEQLASNMSLPPSLAPSYPYFAAPPFNISTLAHVDDLAVLVLRNANANTTVKFRMQTFGARAVCAPDASFYASKDERFVTVRRVGKDTKELHWPQRMSSRACVDNPKVWPSVTVEQLRAQPWRLMQYPIDVLSSSSFNSPQFELGFKFRWPLYDFNSAGLWTAAQATCRVTYYNVTLDYTPSPSGGGGSLVRVGEVPSARFLADGFARHLRFGLVGGFLEDAVLPAFFSPSSTNTDAARLAFLNQEVARLAIASASVFTTGTGPTLAQSSVLNRVLARYPVRAVVLFLGVAVSYAVFAFVLCLAFSLRRSDAVLVSSASANQPATQAVPSQSTSATSSDSVPIPSTLREGSSTAQHLQAQAQARAAENTSLHSEDSVRYRVSLGRFLTPIFTTVFGLWLVVCVLGWSSHSSLKKVNPQKQTLLGVASMLMYAALFSSAILMLFYGRRITALYLSPPRAAAAANARNAPRDGILVEALHAAGLSEAATLYKGVINARDAHDSTRAILKEALVVFLSMFMTVSILAFYTLLLPIRYGVPLNSTSTPRQDQDVGGESIGDNEGPVVTEAMSSSPPAAFPFWPTAMVILLVSLYVTQALLICLAQALVAVPIPKSGATTTNGAHVSGAKVKAD